MLTSLWLCVGVYMSLCACVYVYTLWCLSFFVVQPYPVAVHTMAAAPSSASVDAAWWSFGRSVDDVSDGESRCTWNDRLICSMSSWMSWGRRHHRVRSSNLTLIHLILWHTCVQLICIHTYNDGDQQRNKQNKRSRTLSSLLHFKLVSRGYDSINCGTHNLMS